MFYTYTVGSPLAGSSHMWNSFLKPELLEKNGEGLYGSLEYPCLSHHMFFVLPVFARPFLDALLRIV